MTNTDWHVADIIAALKKKGMSLSALSRQAGYASSTLSNTLVRPWTKGEQIIAAALDVQPEQIWPSRYGNRKRSLKPLNAKLRKNDKPAAFQLAVKNDRDS